MGTDPAEQHDATPSEQAEKAPAKPSRGRWFLQLAMRVFSWAGAVLLLVTLVFVVYAWVVNSREDAAVERMRINLKKHNILNHYKNHLTNKTLSNHNKPKTSTSY